jgi:hypothetical protein
MKSWPLHAFCPIQVIHPIVRLKKPKQIQTCTRARVDASATMPANSKIDLEMTKNPRQNHFEPAENGFASATQ